MLNLGQLVIPDESTLTRFVAARLDLPVSQQLLSKDLKLSIIKRCWEDQLRIKRKLNVKKNFSSHSFHYLGDDFQYDVDLYMACTILKKQIEHIDGKRDKIIIPTIKMKQLRDEAIRETQGKTNFQMR